MARLPRLRLLWKARKAYKLVSGGTKPRGVEFDVIEPKEATMPTNAPEKNFLQSKTLWGIIMSAVPLVSQVTGVEISDTETQSIAGAIPEIIGAVGVLLAIIGRFTAKTNLKIGK